MRTVSAYSSPIWYNSQICDSVYKNGFTKASGTGETIITLQYFQDSKKVNCNIRT